MKVFGGMYEVLEEIGSGGGGVVYKARHMRLDKPVVVKVDKRKIKKNKELYSREVSVLKELKNDHIPQVYDFFEEDGMICTVMEFIQGESLDIPLKRGEVFSQAQVIEWTRQVLDALVYLHSPTHGDPPKGYVHSDIKPANIMRLPDNSVCLIDFNITLAIGEYSFIGRSAGYASPEHYGYDFSVDNENDGTAKDTGEKTELLDGSSSDAEKTELVDGSGKALPPYTGKSHSTGSSTGSMRRILPDARSDIYSLGATMYHLVSGKRPNADAREVKPLSSQKYSKPFVDIITKAMDPDKNKRFQTAQEMLDAINSLKQNDPRSKALRRRRNVGLALSGVLIAGGVCTGFIGLKRTQNTESILKNSEYSAAALESGDMKSALSYALSANPEEGWLTKRNPRGLLALSNAVSPYDMRSSYEPTAVCRINDYSRYIAVTQGGSYCGILATNKLYIADTATGNVINEFDTAGGCLTSFTFIGERLIYAAPDGVTAYDLINNCVLWTGEPATRIAFSNNGKFAAAVDRDASHCEIYDLSGGNIIRRVDFGGRKMDVSDADLMGVAGESYTPYNTLLAVNDDASMVAVSFDDGGVSIFRTEDGSEGKMLPESSCNHFEGAFFGNTFAYSAGDSDGSSYLEYDLEKMEPILSVDYTKGERYCVSSDEAGIIIKHGGMIERSDGKQHGAFAETDEHIRSYSIDVGRTAMLTATKTEILDRYGKKLYEAVNEKGCNMIAVGGKTIALADVSSGEIDFMQYNENEDTVFCRYSPYQYYETRITDDREHIIQFSPSGFRILDQEGNVTNETELPNSASVADQQFRHGSDCTLEVIYKDGTTEIYSAYTGALIRTENREQPDVTVDQCETEHYRSYSKLDRKAQLIDKQTGEVLREFDTVDRLIYIYESPQGLVAHFHDTDSKADDYALLLDDSFETVAVLRCFTDIIGDEVFFDYKDGTIKNTHLLDTETLIEQAKTRLGEFE